MIGEKLYVPDYRFEAKHRKHAGEYGIVVLETRSWVVLEFDNGDRYMYPKIH